MNRGSSSASSRGSGGGGRPPRGGSEGGRSRSQGGREGPRPVRAVLSEADLNRQAPMVDEFLTGLVDSFGLDGQVEVRIDEDVIIATIEGEQTEALVGPRGSVMESIHEITKTVLHRQVDDTARVRIDIAGYAERRRQALSIYASQLINQVMAEGGEIMLEPMSAADRKVIHDAVAGHDGVESYSEGEPPRRFVVIATTGEQAPSDEAVDESPNELEDESSDELPDELVEESPDDVNDDPDASDDLDDSDPDAEDEEVDEG